LAETKNFSDGYEAIFGKKGASPEKKPKAKPTTRKKASKSKKKAGS
jgi:hypothetical protein